MIPFLHGVFATNGGVASDFELIETQTVGAGGAASVTFSSIPGTYKHLQIRAVMRSANAAYWGGCFVTMNSDTSGNYSNHNLLGNGSATFSDAETSATALRIPFGVTGASAVSGIFGASVMDILDYANTSKYKTTRCLNGRDFNGAGTEERIGLTSGNWRSTSAITTLTFTSQSANFVQYTTISLYGIKG